MKPGSSSVLSAADEPFMKKSSSRQELPKQPRESRESHPRKLHYSSPHKCSKRFTGSPPIHEQARYTARCAGSCQAVAGNAAAGLYLPQTPLWEQIGLQSYAGEGREIKKIP